MNPVDYRLWSDLEMILGLKQTVAILNKLCFLSFFMNMSTKYTYVCVRDICPQSEVIHILGCDKFKLLVLHFL